MSDDGRLDRMRGFIAITGVAGKALRMQGTPPVCGDVLNCSGTFRAGDRVFVTMRGTDGGQAVVARAFSAVDAQALPCPPLNTATTTPELPLLRDVDLDVLWWDAFHPAVSRAQR
ncbi:MAG: hypothetical protein JSR34_10980 [Proteobacteria bacterium]|nr:hypothetical protein [Pseudomonadota bacterium]